MKPVQGINSAVKGLGMETTLVLGGEAGRSAGQHVNGSTNCNAKEEAGAFLAGMGCKCALPSHFQKPLPLNLVSYCSSRTCQSN